MKKLLATLAVAFAMSACAYSQVNQGGGAGGVQNPSSGGGGANPSSPAFSVQYANSGVNGLASSSNLLYIPSTNTLESKANTQLNALESLPRVVYDPMNTNYDGGLAAAIAGTSGFTPSQVIQATVDYAECQALQGLAPGMMRIALPTGLVMNIGQIQMWSGQELSGDSLTLHPFLQHNDATKVMIIGHGSSDTITCNGTPHTPGPNGAVMIANIAISGMGPVSGTGDIGIEENGQSWFVYNITGYSNGFGSQAILDAGFENFTYRVGYPAAQMKGCQSFTAGTLTGFCAAVQINAIDSELDYVYATDGAGQSTGHPAGPCYPNCAAIAIGGSNDRANDLFGQISDIDIIANGNSIRGSNWRADGTAREGVRFSGAGNAGGDVINNLAVLGACTDTALQANYNAGAATGCSSIKDDGQANQIYGIQAGASPGTFGPSFTQCAVSDTIVGGSNAPNTYGFLSFTGNTGNVTANDWAYCGAFGGDQASGRVMLPTMSPVLVTGATANVSGINTISLGSTNPLTTLNGAIAGQLVSVFAGFNVTGATVGTSGNIKTCTGLPEPVTSEQPILLQRGGLAGDANFGEICNNPQNNFVHLNWTGNPAVTQPAVVDLYGNQTLRQVPLPNIAPQVQLHGPTAGSGQYCFEQENVFADGSHTVSALACTTTDLAHQTPGDVFTTGVPLTVTYNLWLVSNTTTSGIPIGKYPAPSGGAWDGISVVALGGNGVTAPPATENTTGMVFDPWGVVLNTTANTQPPCIAATRGRMWLTSGGGTGNDVFQICEEQAGAAFGWVTH